LEQEFFDPQIWAVVPALWVKGDDGGQGELPAIECFNDLEAGVKYFAICYIFILFFYFVSNAYFPSVPSAAGVGEVECFGVVDVEVGFCDDVEGFVVVFFLDIAVVVC
jgi:hypothetical protein